SNSRCTGTGRVARGSVWSSAWALRASAPTSAMRQARIREFLLGRWQWEARQTANGPAPELLIWGVFRFFQKPWHTDLAKINIRPVYSTAARVSHRGTTATMAEIA